MDGGVLVALDKPGRDRDADVVGVHVAQVLKRGGADRGIGVALGLGQPVGYRPARPPGASRGFQAAAGDVGGFLCSVADLDRGQADAERIARS